MIGDLFDSPWKVLIVAVVLIVLFGSRKLPDAARSLGRSMRILKKEVGDMHHDKPGAEAQTTPPATAGPAGQLTAAGAPAGQQTQIAALQQQIRDLQRAATTDAPAPTVQAGAYSEPQRTPQLG
jgi:sec-independent protein translocase protein TatA